MATTAATDPRVVLSRLDESKVTAFHWISMLPAGMGVFTDADDLFNHRRGDDADRGGAVRRVFHQLRSHAIEHCDEQFKAIFDAHRPVPIKGRVPTRRWVLGAILVYQLRQLHRFEQGQDLRVGLKPCWCAA